MTCCFLKNQYVRIKTLHDGLGDPNKLFLCRYCLSSIKKENTLLKQNQKCEKQEVISIRTSTEFLINWNFLTYKVEIKFRLYADFEVYVGISNSRIADKAITIF